MGFFERQFRSRFVPAESGYLFRADDVDYWFDAAQVDAFVAEWRRHWHPLVLGAYLLAGVALPAFLYLRGYWGGAFVIGTIGAICMAVNLIYPLRQPTEATLDMFGHATQRPGVTTSGAETLTAFGFVALFAVMTWFAQTSSVPWYNSSGLYLVFWTGYWAWSAMIDLMLWRRGKRSNAAPFSTEEKQKLRTRGMYVVLPLMGLAVWLTPGSDWLDRAFPAVMLAIFVAVDLWISGRRWFKNRAAAKQMISPA